MSSTNCKKTIKKEKREQGSHTVQNEMNCMLIFGTHVLSTPQISLHK